MAPDRQSEGDHDDDDVRRRSSIADASLKARLNRKRTKSGCLTCRKRRIKCGEERPICKNCIKSKRHCEGYNQRVIFKPPTFDFRPVPHGGAHITFQAGPLPGPAVPYQTELIYPGPDPNAHSQLRPRPLECFESPHRQPLQQPVSSQQQNGSQFQHVPCVAAGPFFQEQNYHGASMEYQPSLLVGHAQHPPVRGFGPGMLMPHQITDPLAPPHTASDDIYHFQTTIAQPPPLNVERAASAVAFAYTNVSIHASPPSNASFNVESANHVWGNGAAPESSWPAHTYVPCPELSLPIDHQRAAATQFPVEPIPLAFVDPTSQTSTHTTPEYYEQETHVSVNPSPTHFLNQAAVEVQDDDYYDIISDEDMDIDTMALVAADRDRQGTLNRILHANHINIQEIQTRRYDTFIYNGMLDHYRVEEVANPLRNPATARVFAHFIAVTGPSLSIFERHPRNTSVLFNEGHVPSSQQGLWTYTMPMAALRHQGLLHAMLALASLHIARLKGASSTPSMQHYAWALKRVHHCVGHPHKRLKLTTIAASMLLGFYEIMTADHMKWNMHLTGSKQLFVETDFVGMMQKLTRMKMERAARYRSHHRRSSTWAVDQLQDEDLDQNMDIDERVVSDLLGREVRYGDHGQVLGSGATIPHELDLGKFEMLKDLFWWYCKQDAYQSIISGNPLLMDYSRWANCPPRAPLGKSDAVYGSFDHLTLLLARIAEFAARDRARKLKQIEVNGGQWRPAPGMNIPRPPPQAQPPTPMSSTQSGVAATASFPPQPQGPSPPPPPMFYGMAPPPRQDVQMPASYGPFDALPPTPQSAELYDLADLQTATQAALEEYGKLRAALHTFSASLGKTYLPLESQHQPTYDTPFGTALHYRSYDIGCLWAVYHMAVIVAIRSHPHMPPAAHMAAGVAARETAFHAIEIGRIVAGIVPGSADQPLNPTLGAALCESCMPSFFAAVQYQDTQQRHSTVMRIFSIAQRTGWGSAELIANGCETAWVKAAAAGRGPPYQRVVRPQHSEDPRLNGSWEQLDPRTMPDLKNEGDRRLVKMKADARLNWAIGIMGTEEDVNLIS